MKLEDLGYNDKLEKLRSENDFHDFEMGRVISEHKERYIVKTVNGDRKPKLPATSALRQKAEKIFRQWAIG